MKLSSKQFITATSTEGRKVAQGIGANIGKYYLIEIITISNVLDEDISISWLVAQISLSTYFKVLGYNLSKKVGSMHSFDKTWQKRNHLFK